jgi:hypothetical protein
MEEITDDYESCGDCEYDHSYEYEQAYQWYLKNPCSYCNFNKIKLTHESDYQMRFSNE